MKTNTQKTSKTWKTVQALGGLGSLTAVALFFVAFGLLQQDRSHPPQALMTVAVGLIMVAMPLYWLGRAGVWWTAD